MEVLFKSIDPRATIPTRGTEFSAGFDLYAMEDVTLYPYSSIVIDTGIVMGIPEGYCGVIKPRSGVSIKYSVDNLAGLIDADYRTKSVKVALINHSYTPWNITAKDRFAQIIFIPVLTAAVEVTDIPQLGTRIDGFGSTGQ